MIDGYPPPSYNKTVIRRWIGASVGGGQPYAVASLEDRA
jgi:hypothetical protein